MTGRARRVRAARFAAPALVLAASHAAAQTARPFVVTDSTVRQGPFTALALGRDTIVSSYPRAAREVRFRFSINGLENEFPGGTEHTIYLRPRNGKLLTRIYRFGDEREPPPPTPEESASSEEGVAEVTFRVDLRGVVGALRDSGVYHPPLGAVVRRGELAHVYVVGDPAPLTWDYAALHPGSAAELRDPDGDGIYEGSVAIATEYTRPRTTDGRALWARHADLSAFPALRSSQRLQDAIYRMSLEELTQLVRDDGALSAGAKWPGVWTRDVSLSTILALAIVAPDATRRSLLAKVDSSGRIIQDTGTGGSWPVSSDRMVWALAAWELYAATGDRDWLGKAYEIVKRSAEADLHAVRDERTGLFTGESSFLDWREQSYPRWMQPADIYRSGNVGTNAVHYAAYRTLANMARSSGEPAARWDSVADGIQRGMTARLWQARLGYYGQYRYGRVHLSLSPRAEGLGEALASIYGAASLAQRQAMMRSAPSMAFGTPTFWPFIPGERFYHNATIWPFVTAFSTWAAAEGGNTTAVQQGLDATTRTAALFLTNKENTVAATGHYEGTALNSDRQLWSVAGTIAATYRLLLGIRLEPRMIAFRPMVPPSYGGERTLRGLRYRQATLTVTVRGFGDGVASVKIDGKAAPRAEVAADATGAHTVVIAMNGRWPRSAVRTVGPRFSPRMTRTPSAARLPGKGIRLSWPAVSGVARYVVYRNGAELARTADTTVLVRPPDGLDEYQVLTMDATGVASFLSEPVRVLGAGDEVLAKPNTVPLETEYTGFTGGGYVRLTRERNTSLSVPVQVQRAGTYAIDLRYANGNGPVNTDDKVAVRTLIVDGDTAGAAVMPQRGVNRWNEWGWSNVRLVRLAAGSHTVAIAYTSLDANMNGKENTALLDAVRLTRLSTAP